MATDADTGKEVAVLKGHVGGVCCVAFSPTGKRVLTASDDHTARLWGREMVTRFKGEDLRDAFSTRSSSAQQFTTLELENPILRGITQLNPSLRRGPLSLDYWTSLW